MELKEAVYTRRSVRKYQDKAVPGEVLREILEGACMAPSGINLQPWYFLAVSSDAGRKKLQAYMQETFATFKHTLETRFANNPEVVTETGNFLTTLGGAPVVVLAFLLKEDYVKNVELGNSPIMSVAAAIENLLLMAHDKGLATCWTTAAVDVGPAERIRADFAPDKGKLLSIIMLGYADKIPKAPARRAGRFDIV